MGMWPFPKEEIIPPPVIPKCPSSSHATSRGRFIPTLTKFKIWSLFQSSYMDETWENSQIWNNPKILYDITNNASSEKFGCGMILRIATNYCKSVCARHAIPGAPNSPVHLFFINPSYGWGNWGAERANLSYLRSHGQPARSPSCPVWLSCPSSRGIINTQRFWSGTSPGFLRQWVLG